MEGPTRESVQHAISTLFHSLNTTNKVELDTEFPLALNSTAGCTAQYLEAIKLIRDAVLQQLDDRTIQRHHNSHLPISSLPVELLVDIFRLSLASVQTWKDERTVLAQLYTLSEVCVHWWQLILTTPSFWTNIHGNNIPAIKQQLERSANLPLSINFQSSPGEPLPLLEPCNSGIMTRVMDEAHRFRVLRLDLKAKDWCVIAPYLAAPMPILEEAYVEVTGREQNNLPALEFVGSPNLHTLELGRVEWTSLWANAALSSLTRLEVHLVDYANIEDFLRLLESCSSLAELRIWGNGSGGNGPEHAIPLIDLPHLRILEVTAVESSTWVPLIKSIHSPNLKRYHLSDASHPSGCTQVAHTPLSPDRPSLLQSVITGVDFDRITATFDHDTFYLHGSARADATSANLPFDQKWGLEIVVADQDPWTVAHRIHLRDIPVSLQFRSKLHHPSVMRFFPTTTFLMFRGDIASTEECIAFLCEPDVDTGRTTCPRLSEIFLHIDTERGKTQCEALEENKPLMENILRLVQTRWTLDDPAALNGRSLRVTCGGSHQGGERYIFEEATGRFTLQVVKESV